MNTVKNVALLILLAVVMLGAQTPGGSFGLTNTGTCQTPALGYFGFCKPAAGGAVTFTDEGSPYAKASLVAIPGPIGVQGPKGDTGATGAIGPAGTLSGPICVTLTADVKANLILTPVPCK